MSHICTQCKKVFDEGTDVLKGCPSCGCKKFEFVRAGRPEGSRRLGDFDPGIGGEILISREMGVRKPPKRSSPQLRRQKSDQPTLSTEGSARSSDLSDSHIPDKADRSAEKTLPPIEAPAGTRKSTIRAHTEKRADKSQAKAIEGSVESIRISEPGTYELNLPSLFERDELIMAVKDGTYLIDLSTALKKPKKE